MFSGLKDRPSTHQYKCDQCERAYKNKKSLVNHLTFECRVDPSFPCPRCNCQCKHKFSLKRHLIEIHKVEPSQLASFGLGICISHFKTLKWSFYIYIFKYNTNRSCAGPIRKPIQMRSLWNILQAQEALESTLGREMWKETIIKFSH